MQDRQNIEVGDYRDDSSKEFITAYYGYDETIDDHTLAKEVPYDMVATWLGANPRSGMVATHYDDSGNAIRFMHFRDYFHHPGTNRCHLLSEIINWDATARKDHEHHVPLATIHIKRAVRPASRTSNIILSYAPIQQSA